MKLYLKTFGCRANHYDTEALRSIAVANGASIVDNASEADYAVFNSCAVTTDAEADLRQAVRRANRDKPGLRSLVMGCASALEMKINSTNDSPVPGRIRALPGVEEIFDGADVRGVAGAMGFSAAMSPGTTVQSGARALLRIQDGCDEHCTFCATTIARGANRSRDVEVLADEASRLADRHSEIVLTGVHIGSYGVDAQSSLSELVATLINRVPSVRFRLSSIEATEVDDALVELFGQPRHLAPYLHAPLQSGSDRVLKRMGRHWYTRRSYSRSLERLALRVNTLGLGADVIAGFPGETEADHIETMLLVRELPFTSLHVFPYSARPGTSAERLGNRIDGSTISRRARELRDLSQEKSERWARSRDGQYADVVVTGAATGAIEDGRVARDGLTEDYVKVAVADSTFGRGARFDATLSFGDGRLTATPLRNDPNA